MRSEISIGILKYILEHPDSKDTLDGIVQWWLLNQSTNRRDTLRSAVRELLKKGMLLEVKSANSRAYYQLNPLKKDDIENLLAKHRTRRRKLT